MFNNRTATPWNRGLRMAITGGCMAVLGIWSMQRATADERDKKTIVTISAPVEVPGKVLPPGTYVFKLLDSSSNRNIVQIFDKDEKQLYATVLAVPDYRLNPPDKPLITFEERPSGTPMAVKAWFYPGDEYGQQFVYPRNQAVEIAKRTNQNVLSMRDDMAKHISAPSKAVGDASVQELQKTDVSGVNPSGEAVELTVVVSTTPVK
ncbi:MAG: hypothetical protein JWO19_3570 [Bryobacterales bacterium]|nr:hypothetical protein [Bryobacterales bacterium]